jgi:glycosyltransferase involved in cell wall biosynthesis
MKTKNVFPEVDIQQINACDVNSMRNLSIKLALGDNQDKKKYDYVVCLDDDHRYPEEFLIKFINLMQENKWPILTGLTCSKAKPYRNTQYHQFLTPINTEENCVRCDNPKEEVIQIEASGPVGMVMNTNIFEKLEFPYYYVEYGKKEVDGVEKDTLLGGDLVFSKKLLEKKTPIRLDLNTTFPHSKSIYLNRGRIIDV